MRCVTPSGCRIPRQKWWWERCLDCVPNWRPQGDLDIPDEEALRKQIHSHRFRRMIGDPLFEELIGPADNLRFLSTAACGGLE